MSPRSQEFMDQARDRVAAAAEMLAADHLEAAVSAAYYSMLYAARAALSEQQEHARTHRGAGISAPAMAMGGRLLAAGGNARDSGAMWKHII